MPRDVTIQTDAAGLSGAQGIRVRRAGFREMVRRARPLTAIHPLLVGVVLLTTPYAEIAPGALYTMLAACGALAVARMVLAFRIDSVLAARPQLALALFATGAVLASSLWGAFAAYTLGAFAFEWTTFLVLLCTAALTAGCITSLGIHFPLFLFNIKRRLEQKQKGNSREE